ncbi:hypothetical protein RBLE17_29320 [Rhodobacteraceae bacterium LE17]|nr:hypothetical protein [Rhodobacteraceae bacterium LE17]
MGNICISCCVDHNFSQDSLAPSLGFSDYPCDSVVLDDRSDE